jgi:alanine dehydrogenase
VKVGIPREVKNHEYRVAITPAGVNELVRHGHEVYVEKDAGAGSSIADDDYATAGATILGAADDVWATGDLILKTSTTGCARARPSSPTSTSPPTSR